MVGEVFVFSIYWRRCRKLLENLGLLFWNGKYLISMLFMWL